MFDQRAGRLAATVLAATAALLVSSRPAAAGIVNVQSILATEAEEGLSGALTGSIDWRTGNTDYLFLSAAPVARYRAGDHLFIGILRADRKTSEGTELVSRLFEHGRYRYSFTDRLLGEVFAQHEFDEIRRLQVRALVGAGPKFDVFKGEGYSASFGVAYMLEYERLRDDMQVDAGTDDLQHRISSYLLGHYEIDDRLQLVETFYVQPRLTDPNDIRFLNDSTLVVSVTKKLSFNTTFNVSFDNAPPATIEKLDTALTSSVTYDF